MMMPLEHQDTVLLLTDVHTAAVLRNERVLRILMKEADRPFENGIKQALQKCSQDGDPGTAKFIFHTLNDMDSEIRYSYHWYLVGNAHWGNLDMIEGLLDELKIYHQKPYNSTVEAVYQAAWEGHHEVVVTLLKAFPFIAKKKIRLRLIAAHALKEKVITIDEKKKRRFPSIADMIMMEYGLVLRKLNPQCIISIPFCPSIFEKYQRRSSS